MVVKVKEKAPAVKAALKVLDEVGEKVDRWAELDEKIKKAKAKIDPLVKEQAALRKELDATEKVVQAAATEKVELVGLTGGILEYGPKACQVVAVDKAGVRSALGDVDYFTLAEISVGALRDYLTKPQFDKFVSEEYVGSRRVKYTGPSK